METKKKYQSPEVKMHRVIVESHLLASTGAFGGPTANFIQNPGVAEEDDGE